MTYKQMTDSAICEKCYAPGSCYKGFQLISLVGWVSPEELQEKVESAMQVLKSMEIDFFIPYNIHKQYNKDLELLNQSRNTEKVSMTFQCTRLKDGICSDYENRPELCKIYKPMSDDLCKVKSFKGIPIFYQEGS